jgi:pimeloyl-ACP methyl ester carboxylesterase
MTTQLLQPYPDLPLSMADTGAGKPVLVLHGGGGPASVAGIVDHFATTGRVLAPTHPGWDDTPRPDWFSGVDSLVETYLDLLDDLDLNEVVVIGSSFGGWLAAEMAVRDRNRRVSHVVLLDAIGPLIPGHEVRMPGSGNPPPGTASGQPRMGPPPSAIQALLAYAGPSLNDPKLLHRLARVKASALVVWGENDAVVRPDFGRAYAAAFPNGRFELIPGAGHVPTRDAPEATLAVIDAFLS